MYVCILYIHIYLQGERENVCVVRDDDLGGAGGSGTKHLLVADLWFSG